MTELLLMYLIGVFGSLAYMTGSESYRQTIHTNEDIFYTVILCLQWPALLAAGYLYSDNIYIVELRQKIAKKIDKLKPKE